MVAALLSGGGCSQRRDPPRLGLDLLTVTSDADSIPFVDVFKTSSPWRPEAIDASSGPRTLTLDQNGWIMSLAAGQAGVARIFSNEAGRYPAGTYTLLYDGEGLLEVRSNAATVISRRPGRLDIRVAPMAGPGGVIEIVERATDPGDPIRNIRMILPGFEKTYRTSPFNPVFLAELAPFHTIRYMAWQAAGRSDLRSWSDRRSPDYETQALSSCCGQHRMSGVALEYQIDLANTLGADPWFTIEAKASDDYVRHLAALVHRRLKPGLRAYVEYGNELWNPYFRSDRDYIQNEGARLGLSRQTYEAGTYYYVRRAAEIFRIWNAEFRAEPHRIARVIESRMGDPGLDEKELSYLRLQGGNADVLAVSAYVSPPSLISWRPVDAAFYEAILRMAPRRILDLMDAEVDRRMKPLFERHAAIATKYGVELAAYEGGEGLATNMMDPSLRPLYQARIADVFASVNRDPGMGRVYKNLLSAWFQSGGKLFLHFADVEEPNLYGNYGLLEYQDQDPRTSVKYQALMNYARSRPAGR